MVKLCHHVEIIFMSPFACGRRHYVVGLSVRPSVYYQIFILSFFAFNAVASLDNISLRAGRIRSGVGGQGQLDFSLPLGQVRGVKTNLNKKVGGSRQLFIFFSSLFRIIFFRVGGKVGQTNTLFYFYYFICFAKSIF